MSNPSTRTCGDKFEQLAAEYLQQQNKGMCLIQRNFRCRMGEIDLIFIQKGAKKDQIVKKEHVVKEEQVVFVEVRFRNNTFYGGGIQSVDFRKQRKLIKAAGLFLKTRPLYSNLPCRFDVVGITIKDDKPVIEWIQNAFQAF